MAEQFTLKAISNDAIPAAIEKADQYRDLNDPEQAESICLDILVLEPDNQRTLVILILALTDQFQFGTRSARNARAWIPRLDNEYLRVYYTGLIHERTARALLGRGMTGSAAYGVFRDAMDWYEKAEAIRPGGNDDAILRWNSCVRTIQKRRLEPPMAEMELPLE